MATASKQCLATDPPHYSWSFPGSPIRVHLELTAVKRAQERVNKSIEAGLLLGEADGQVTTVRDFRALAKHDSATVKRVVAESKPGSVVGYYRFDRGAALRLDESDLALADACFRDPNQVFLLAQPADAGPANASFFFREGGRMNGDFPFLEFPFDAGLLASAEKHKHDAARRRALEMPAASAPAPRKRRAVGKIAAWIFVAAALAACAIAAVRFYPDAISHVFPQRPAAAPAPVAPSMGLQAERHNGDLRLTWNRDAAVVAGASSGVLSIRDGASTFEFPLDGPQVRSGNTLYSPLSDRVHMQLAVSGAAGSATESVIVIVPRTGPPQVQQAAAPAPAPAVRRAAPQVEPESEAARAEPLRQFTPPPAPRKHSAAPVVDEAPPLTAAATQAPSILTRPVIVPLRMPPLPEPKPAADKAAPVAAPYSPPVPVRQVMPPFPQALRSVVIRPKVVQLLVSIDENGKVVKAEPYGSQRDVHQMMISAAQAAAVQWRFEPAHRGNQTLPSQMILKFNFEPR